LGVGEARNVKMNIASQTSHRRGTLLPLHRHARPYAALVLRGDYEERSIDGRFHCTRGNLIFHPPFHEHLNVFGASGAMVLNVLLPVDWFSQYRVVKVTDIATIESRALLRPSSLADALFDDAMHRPVKPAELPGWMVHMVECLVTDAAVGRRTKLATVAAASPVSLQHASRAFNRHFAATPSKFRLEHKLRRAFGLLRAGASPSYVASEVGFSDQSHLSREIKRFSGHTPREISRAESALIQFKTRRVRVARIADENSAGED
jgi:AraC-like DNA-binding protein